MDSGVGLRLPHGDAWINNGLMPDHGRHTTKVVECLVGGGVELEQVARGQVLAA